VVGDERSGPISGVSSVRAEVPRTEGETQSASFDVGGLRLELSAAPGATRLVVATDDARDTYVVDPAALASWAVATAKLLTLEPATNPDERAEFRTPFLIDRESRASIAFEGLVSEGGVSYRLLVRGAGERVAGLMTTAAVVRGVCEAARGAGSLARPA
jgi:hypothetical protein